MLNETTELATWIYALHRALIEDDYDADGIMNKVGFDFSAIGSTSDYISKRSANLVWKAVEDVTGDDAYCLKIIPFVSDTYLNSLIITIQSCESIDDALRSLIKYYRLVDATSKITVSIDQSVSLSITNRREDFPAPKQDIDLIFGLITKHAPSLMIDEINPTCVKFTRPTPINEAAYLRYFPCPVYFGQDQNAIEFSLHLPSESIPSANPALWKHLQEYLSRRLMTLSNTVIEEDVKRELVGLLPNGTPKLRDVAARLNLSERTLQRKLQTHDICFTSLLYDTRLSLAKEYLQTQDKTIQAIAYELGFSESGNFIRFFKKQTGQTPHAFVKCITV